MQKRIAQSTKYAASLLGALAVVACASAPKDAAQAEATGTNEAPMHASNRDPGTSLRLLELPDHQKIPLLVTNRMAYRFACDLPAGVTALVKGAGFDENALAQLAPIQMNDTELLGLLGRT